MPRIITSFSIGDTAYYPIFATASIYKVTVKDIVYKNGAVYYKLYRADIDKYMNSIPENQVMNFSEAQTILVNYLQEKLTQAQHLTA